MNAPTFDHIPAELQTLTRWIVWKLEPRANSDKPTKVPYTVGHRLASTTEPGDWMTFAAARTLAETNGYNGIGFVFTDTPYVGIDLDKVLTDDGVNPEAAAIVEQLDSYTEVSQSGTGLHVIAKGSLPPGRRRQGWLEMYDRSSPRYFALTGTVWNGHSTIQDRTAAVASVHRERFGNEAAPSPVVAPAQSSEVLTLMEQAAPKLYHRLVIAGETVPGKSESESDEALAILAARFTRDPTVIRAVLDASGLTRPKWTTHKSYLERTIAHALKVVPAPSAADPTRRARSVAEIIANGLPQPPAVVVPGLAWKGRITLVAATEGMGKSTLFAEAARAVTTGQPFLGKFPTVQGAVLWVVSEEAEDDVILRAVALDPRHSGLAHLYLQDHPVQPLDDLEAEIANRAPRLVIIDTVHSWAGTLIEQASQSDSWRPVIETIQRAARRGPLQPAILMSAEATKKTGDYKDSASIGHGVDVVFSMRQKKSDPISRQVERKKARWAVSDLWYQQKEGRLVQIPAPDASDKEREALTHAADDQALLGALDQGRAGVVMLAERLHWGKPRVEQAMARVLKRDPAEVRVVGPADRRQFEKVF